jgi:hypothetical protein
MSTKMSASELHGNLDMFYGTENYYRHSLVRGFVYTDGVQYLAQHAGAYWLLDKIATLQLHNSIKNNRDLQNMQFWKLEPKGNGAVLKCVADSGHEPVYREEIEYTDFPFLNNETFTLYVAPSYIDKPVMVCLLPSEY